MAGSAEFEMDALFQGKVFTKLKTVGEFVDAFQKVLLLTAIEISKRECVLEKREQERLCRVRAENLAFETVRDKFRDTANMVDVSVGKKEVVDIFRGDGPGLHGRNGIMPLCHTAIDEHVNAFGSQKVTGAGDGILSANMRDVYHLVLGFRC